MKSAGKKRLPIILISVFLVIAIALGAAFLYVNDYYHADDEAIAAFAPMKEAKYRTLDNGSIVFEPENAKAGFIFYPGGKVENDAYMPLMAALCREGILSVLIEMPFNLAVLDVNAADGVAKDYPEIEDWYIGGHSLGGSMAATYLEKHKEEYKGLVLLGSYSTADLSDSELCVLSVYGSEDKVMNREKYEENRSNLPRDFTEVVIDGGCHANFGMYGEQDGDGAATVTNEEQIIKTSELILEMINSRL